MPEIPPAAKADAPVVCDEDFAALIEAVYSPGGSDADWLQRVVACARPGLDRGQGLVGCLFVVVAGGAPTMTAVVGAGSLLSEPDELASAFLPGFAGRAVGSRAGTAYGIARAAACGAGASARQCSGIVAAVGARRAPARAGCALLAPLPRAAGLSRDAVAVWSRVAEHIGVALHLRRAACDRDAIWRGLLSGRWQLVDHFDAGGRRFVIARGKPAPLARPPIERLSGRERDACARAAVGCANKVIAADLGLAVSTVGMLLLRATRKLRCRSREELIRAVRFV